MGEVLMVTGVVSSKAKHILEISGDDWFFVDYPPRDVQYGKYGNFEILESMDQYQRKFPCVPCDREVVCRIKGIDINSLPIKHAWYENENSIKIEL